MIDLDKYKRCHAPGDRCHGCDHYWGKADICRYAQAAGSGTPVIGNGANFSDCGKYRYTLWRYWGTKPLMLWVMLNPSTADEVDNDPTVERCQRRAKEYGYGGVVVCNIFALRSTDPKALYSHPDPVGPYNDEAIIDAAKDAGLVVCGWGNHGQLCAPGEQISRGEEVVRMLLDEGIMPHCLKVTKRGHPGHPLYVPYAAHPRPFVPRRFMEEV